MKKLIILLVALVMVPSLANASEISDAFADIQIIRDAGNDLGVFSRTERLIVVNNFWAAIVKADMRVPLMASCLGSVMDPVSRLRRFEDPCLISGGGIINISRGGGSTEGGSRSIGLGGLLLSTEGGS